MTQQDQEILDTLQKLLDQLTAEYNRAIDDYESAPTIEKRAKCESTSNWVTIFSEIEEDYRMSLI